MNLEKLFKIFKDQGCRTIYVKNLSPNDNSKNQVYLAGNFDLLNIFPFDEIKPDSSGDWKKDRFKATLNFVWVTSDGELSLAPKAQFILYPKYPEIRFSGFLQNCKNGPSDLMTIRLEGRLLFLSVTSDGNIIGYVSHPESTLSNEFNSIKGLSKYGVFSVIEFQSEKDSRDELISQLKRIHELGWINSKRLDRNGKELECNSPNCGGYTLEAELGIIPNGISEPDYLGWELKQFGVTSFNSTQSKAITLMTPEPTGGFYKDKGVIEFLKKYGYPDRNGREDRINFGGVHKVGIIHPLTNLRMELIGYDINSGNKMSSDGRISLLDKGENEVASWSFGSLLKHWNRKHNQACYIPSISQISPERKYYYGSSILLGKGTDFTLLLKQLALGNIYYDPGIKLENASKGTPKTKRRSQFRIKSGNLGTLYKANESLDLLKF